MISVKSPVLIREAPIYSFIVIPRKRGSIASDIKQLDSGSPLRSTRNDDTIR